MNELYRLEIIPNNQPSIFMAEVYATSRRNAIDRLQSKGYYMSSYPDAVLSVVKGRTINMLKAEAKEYIKICNYHNKIECEYEEKIARTLMALYPKMGIQEALEWALDVRHVPLSRILRILNNKYPK